MCSKTYMDKIPRTSSIDTLIDIAEQEILDRKAIQFYLKSDFLFSVDKYDDWLMAFYEYLCLSTRSSPALQKQAGIKSRRMYIYDYGISLEIDIHKSLLYFNFPKNRLDLRDIIYDFIENLVGP